MPASRFGVSNYSTSAIFQKHANHCVNNDELNVMYYKITSLFILLYTFSSYASGEECYHSTDADTPTKRFKDKTSGAVFDTQTGLTWARCPLGMKWDQKSCRDVPDRMTWSEAHTAILELNGQKGGYAGFRNWRLPTLEELAGLVESKCYEPAINSTIFPNTPNTGFWSSTPAKYSRQGAWLVYFRNGSSYMGNQEYGWVIRPVRK